MNAIAQIFTYDAEPIRSVMVADKKWIVGKDVCTVLGISKYRDALAQLDDDERVSAAVDTPGGRQNMTLINESGLYALMLISRSPKVKPFRKWVTSEVLPAIQRTGQYGTAAALPQSFAEALQLAADQAKRLEEQAPAVEAFNTYLTATGDLSVADAAKQLSRHPNIDLGQNRLFAKLRELAWIFKPADGAWRVYQRALDAGWLAERAQSHPHPTTGETVVDAPQVRVTPRGLAELHRRLAPGEQLAITAP